MQKTKTSLKFLGLAIFILAIILSLNLNRLTFATDLTDGMKQIQEAINTINPETQGCLYTCFIRLTYPKTAEDFKTKIIDKTTSGIDACIGVTSTCKGQPGTNATNLLGKLREYVANPSNSELLNSILALLGSSTPHDITGCITDENNAELKSWLKQLENNDIIKNFKASSSCSSSSLTLECLKNSIIPAIEKVIPAFQGANSPLAGLYQQSLTVLKDFANCPTKNNFDNLQKFYTDYFVPENQKIIKSIISTPNPDEDNCLIEFIGFGASDILKTMLGGVGMAMEAPRMVIRVFAAIALGVRAITGYVANAFVWSFTGLPKNLGGYVNFAPIYDASSKTGIWYTVLGFANLGIILGMIFMAIATIFRIEKYSWKKMLPKLLLVALLVNFSLIILGIFVDISNYLSITFLSQSTNNRLGDTIKDVITTVSCPLAGDKQHFVPDMTAVTVAIILSGIFLFQFAGLLFYVITRIFTIWICVATAPLAFLGMAIDSEPVKKAVDMWRDRFTQAIISLPILAFTLYFVLVLLKNIGAQVKEIANSGNALNFPMLIAYAIVIIGAAQVLRFVAKSIGVEQIEQGYAFARKAVTGAVIAGTAAIGGAALTGIAGTQTFRKIGQGLTQTPILNKIGYKMLDQSDAARFTNIRKSEEKMKVRDKNEVLSIANGEAPLRMNKQAYADYMAARSIALKNGWLKHDDAALDAIRKDIDNKNPDLNAKDIVHAFPQYFKFGKNGEIETIDPTDVKAVADNIKKLSPEDMPKHAEEVTEAIKDAVKKAGGNVDAAINEFIKEMALAKTSQIRAFFDNIAEDEYITGETFGGTSTNPKPWAGEDGEIANRLRNLETKANQKYQDAVNNKLPQTDIDKAYNEWSEIQTAIDELNTKLKTSPPLQDTLKAQKIK